MVCGSAPRWWRRHRAARLIIAADVWLRRTGQWTSQWTVTPTDSSRANMAGKTHISTHYFENGNMQMVSDKSHASVIAFTVRAGGLPWRPVPLVT